MYEDHLFLVVASRIACSAKGAMIAQPFALGCKPSGKNSRTSERCPSKHLNLYARSMDMFYGHPHDSRYSPIRDFLTETRSGIQCESQPYRNLLFSPSLHCFCFQAPAPRTPAKLSLRLRLRCGRLTAPAFRMSR